MGLDKLFQRLKLTNLKRSKLAQTLYLQWQPIESKTNPNSQKKKILEISQIQQKKIKAKNKNN